MRNTKENYIPQGPAVAVPFPLPLTLALIGLVALLVVVAYPRNPKGGSL